MSDYVEEESLITAQEYHLEDHPPNFLIKD